MAVPVQKDHATEVPGKPLYVSLRFRFIMVLSNVSPVSNLFRRGVEATIYSGTGCANFGCLFQEENEFWGVILGKITNRHKFWGAIFERKQFSI